MKIFKGNRFKNRNETNDNYSNFSDIVKLVVFLKNTTSFVILSVKLGKIFNVIK